ncbi:MAG: GGDEF domain-containing protein [Tepidiformaceae bacterium]
MNTRKLGGGLLAILALCELVVFARFSAPLGMVLVLCTAGLTLVLRRTANEAATRATEDAWRQRREAEEGFLVDSESGLPNRRHLIDQLAREIARAQRYSHDMTLTMIEVARMGEFQNAWGADATRAAVVHVADTLRRVTRASDFLARVDESHFAVVLMQCDELQAGSFGERIALAVSNRPLRSNTSVKVPLYVSVDVSALQYQTTRFRGPLDFLSAAGGDVAPVVEGRRPIGTPASPRNHAADPQTLRRQLVKDYYPEGKMNDFADAYRTERRRARRAI